MPRMDNDWDPILTPEFNKDYYKKLRVFLNHEYASQKIYPDMYSIFSAIKTVSFSKVKVVILGQDPYHGENQAHGMSFSVREGVALPRSLINIFKEIEDDLGVKMSGSGCLIPWAEQGVLLLNCVLTVRAGQPGSHRNQGWEQFTNHMISALNQRDDPVIFLLWGRDAISKSQLITNNHHFILKTVHPSPLSASRGFFGCKHFSRTNEILISMIKSPINWLI